MIASIKKHPFHWALLASLLLHVFFYFFTGMGIRFLRLLQVLPVAMASPQREQPPLVFEVVETPESARREKAPQEAKHKSDKNTLAQSPEVSQDFPSKAALAKTEPPFKVTSLASQSEQKSEVQKQSPEVSTALDFRTPSFSRDFLTEQKPRSALEASLRTARQISRGSSFSRLGSFSFSSYQWNFKPFATWLQKKIKSNLHPPPAFTQMDLIDGQTTLSFKVYRDGSLHDLEVLHHRGHESLREASKRAIELSAPFQKLPPDFPKEYLEITAQFDYTLLNSPDAKD